MMLVLATFWMDSVFLLKFPFCSHVQVFSYEISLVCHLKYLYYCFTSHFRFFSCCIVDQYAIHAVSGCYNKSAFAHFHALFKFLY